MISKVPQFLDEVIINKNNTPYLADRGQKFYTIWSNVFTTSAVIEREVKRALLFGPWSQQMFLQTESI